MEELQDLLSSSWEVMLGLVAGHTSPVLISKLQLVSSKLQSCLATLDTASHLPAFRRKCFGLGLDWGGCWTFLAACGGTGVWDD